MKQRSSHLSSFSVSKLLLEGYKANSLQQMSLCLRMLTNGAQVYVPDHFLTVKKKRKTPKHTVREEGNIRHHKLYRLEKFKNAALKSMVI